jgi:hypothetical protein
MIELITKILAGPIDAWISNGAYRLYEKSGEYYISERKPMSPTWQTVYTTGDLSDALSRYIDYCEEGNER